MNMHSFSIVIPAYNAAKFIEKCLECVIKQSYSNYEIIIVNDGSSDNTEKLIHDFMMKNPDVNILYKYKENGGAASARGVGIEMATKEYVAFLDADDIWYPNKLEVINSTINTVDNAQVFYSDEIEVTINGKRKVRKYRELSLQNPMEDLIINGNALSTSTVVVETNIMKSNNTFILGKRAAEDIECWVTLAEHGARFYHIAQCLGEYRRVATSLTLCSLKYMVATDEIIDSFYDKLDSSKYSNDDIVDLKRKKRVNNLYSYGRYHHLNGDFKKAKEQYKLALDEKVHNYRLICAYILAMMRIKC